MFILPAGDGRRLVKHVKAEGAAERFTEVGELCFVQEEQGRGHGLLLWPVVVVVCLTAAMVVLQHKTCKDVGGIVLKSPFFLFPG